MKRIKDNIQGILIGHIKLPRITVHMKEFNPSHMPNSLDTNKIKCCAHV